MSLSQQELGDGLFELRYSGRHFLMRAFPVRIVEVEGSINLDDLNPRIREFLMGPVPTLPVAFLGFGAVELVATTRCNLRCTHCTARSFDGEAESTFYGMPSKDMTRDTMFAAIDAGIRQLEMRLEKAPGVTPTFEMFVTGGEPLLVLEDLLAAFSFARKRLAALGRDNYVFTPHIVTNGTLIDGAAARALARAETALTLALDSPANQVRVDALGTPATPRAIGGLRHLIAAQHPRTSVNVVIAGECVDKLDEVMSYLEGERAFDGITTIQLSPLAPPIQHTQHAGRGLSPRLSGYSDPRACRVFSEKLIEYSKKFSFDMKDYGKKVGALLQQGGSLYRCPVAEWKWCAVPSGDVFACHQLVGIESFMMGNLHNEDWYDSPASWAIRSRFLERTVLSVSSCRECALCSTCVAFVDCPARSWLERGDISVVPEHYCQCGKIYLEKLLGEQICHLVDHGQPAAFPLSSLSERSV